MLLCERITNEKPPQITLPIRILELEAKIENRPTVLDEKRCCSFEVSNTLIFGRVDRFT